jgi:membrane protease YdiL (CAAX protease family)
MLLYSIFILSRFERVLGLLPDPLAGQLRGNLSGMAIATEIVAFVPPVLFFFFLSKRDRKKIDWFSFVPFDFWSFIVSLALWVPVAALIVNIGIFMGVDNGFIDPLRTSVPKLNIFATCIVPAILEEFFMRGAVLTSLRKGGRTFAVFFSSVCFAMLHGNLYNFLGPFLAGLVFAVMTVLTGSVLPAIGAHFIHNAFSYYIGSAVLKISNQISMEIVLFAIIVLFLLLTYVTLSQFQNVLLYEEVSEAKGMAEKPLRGIIFATVLSIPMLGYYLFFCHNVGLFAWPF